MERCIFSRTRNTKSIRKVYLRFWCVIWWIDVAHVLCTLEDAECQRCQKVTCSQQASCWTQCETGALAQEVAHFFQLWDAIFTENSLILKFLENGTVFGACMFWHQIQNCTEYRAPCLVFDVGVINVWNCITTEGGEMKEEERKNTIKFMKFKKMAINFGFCSWLGLSIRVINKIPKINSNGNWLQVHICVAFWNKKI